jgi:hypothetical protein
VIDTRQRRSRWAELLAALRSTARGNAVIQEILAAAGLTEAERASIDANQVPSLDEVPR